MRYDAVLFDLDGTLAASAPGILGSVRHTIDQLGRPQLDEETLRGFIGPSMYDSMQRFCGLSPDLAEKAVAIYRAHYKQAGVLNATVYPGIPNLLRQLKAAGCYLAVATSKPLTSARQVLAHFGLSRYFDRIIGADMERRETGKAALLRDALPARYQRAAMVGDRRFDMEAAKEVGIDAIGAGWGYGTPEELLAAGADVVAATVEDAGLALLGQDFAHGKGFFISIEGVDGSGKTTQMNAIAAHIKARGYDVLTTREPGGTPISEDIRGLVLDPEKTVCAETEALLYAAARAQHVGDVIRPAIARGQAVLCDRFVDSSVVYQGAGRELGIERVTAINQFAIGTTMPDLTILLMMDPQAAFLRRSSATALDRLERAGEAFFARVYDAYLTLARTYPERIRCISAQHDIETVTREAIKQVDRLLLSR